MKQYPIIISCAILIILCSCQSNRYLHQELTPENIQKVVQNKDMIKNDTLWLSKRTICIKSGERSVQIGTIKNGRKKGKWFYYHLTHNDSIDCFQIKKYRKNDTLVKYAVSKNYRWF